MAILWTRSGAGFVATTRECVRDTAAAGVAGPSAIGAEFQIVAFREGSRPARALIAAAGVSVRVNGAAVVGGLRVLHHKDELVVGAQQLFFSAESVPAVEVYQHDESGRRPRCPVCRAEIQDGQSVVRCPGCSRLYHQIEAGADTAAKPCWTYSPACRFCEHPTSMSGEPTWRPDDFEQ